MNDSVSGAAGASGAANQQNYPIKLNIRQNNEQEHLLFDQGWHIGDSTNGEILPEGEVSHENLSPLDKLCNEIKPYTDVDDFGNPVIKKEFKL